MGMSGVYGPADEAECLATLRRALDMGVNHFDTSASYGRGHNETLVGKAIAGRRDEVVLATKFGIRRDQGRVVIDSSPGWARASCEESLRRLGVDAIDLFYVHRRDSATPIEATMEMLAALVSEGKVRHVGLSEVATETLRRAHSIHPVSAVQMEYSLLTRDVEEAMLPTCRELGVALVAYSPFGSGMLTARSGGDIAGDMDALRERGEHEPRFAPQNLEHNLRLVAVLGDLASEIGCTPTQLALAWLLAQGDDVVPIPGTRTIAHLEQNTAAARIELSPDVLGRIGAAIPRGAAAGARLGPAQAAHVGH